MIYNLTYRGDYLFPGSVVLGPKDLNKVTPEEDLVIFWGGEDISPKIYNQKPNSYMHQGTKELSKRDEWEYRVAKHCAEFKIPTLGICRGAQLMCCVDGGSLFQHVDRHGNAHMITLKGGHRIPTSSLHHQMMNLEGTVYELLGWCDPALSEKHLNDKEENIEVRVEPEIVFFPRINSLCIQGHPEYCSTNHPLVIETFRLIKFYFGDNHAASF